MSSMTTLKVSLPRHDQSEKLGMEWPAGSCRRDDGFSLRRGWRRVMVTTPDDGNWAYRVACLSRGSSMEARLGSLCSVMGDIGPQAGEAIENIKSMLNYKLIGRASSIP